MFWFKKKKIVVDAFTVYRSVYDLYSIKPAVFYFPEQIKRLENSYIETDSTTNVEYKLPTIKKCLGILDLYKHGFILPMWTDFVCQPQKAAENKCAPGLMQSPFMFNVHDKRQFSGLFDDHIVMKLVSPWMFREKTGVKFLWTTPSWNRVHENNFSHLPAVVSYEYQSQVNVNIFINKKSEDFILTSGTPMVHIIPLTEHKVEFRNHLVDIKDKEYQKLDIPYEYSSLRPDRYKRWVKEKTNQQTKCPFGFGK